MSQKHRVGIIGCSPGRGRDHLRAFLEHADRFGPIAIADKDPERLNALATEFAIERAYDDGEAMLAAEKPDILCFVCLPQIRLPLIELGLAHQVKVIAYEKPMATDLPEARRIHDLCRKAGVQTIVSHQQKYGAHWHKVKEIIDAGEIGDVEMIHASSKGWMLHYATHLADYMLYLNNGHRATRVTGHIHGAGKLTDNHPSPDYVLGCYEFENGVRGLLECGTCAPSLPGENSFWLDAGAHVRGSHGYAQVIVGTGWRAVTKSDGFISGDCRFDPNLDQPKYIGDLADWLDDPARIHPCNGDMSYHGFEMMAGACLSALDHCVVDLQLTDDRIQPLQPRMREALGGAEAI